MSVFKGPIAYQIYDLQWRGQFNQVSCEQVSRQTADSLPVIGVKVGSSSFGDLFTPFKVARILFRHTYKDLMVCRVLYDFGYVSQLKRTSRTVLVSRHGCQQIFTAELLPQPMYLTELSYRKFGFSFDHIYALQSRQYTSVFNAVPNT
jgi:hypothetical protein